MLARALLSQGLCAIFPKYNRLPAGFQRPGGGRQGNRHQGRQRLDRNHGPVLIVIFGLIKEQDFAGGRCGRFWHQEATIKKFTTKARVYWSDCDPADILYFGNFFRFFEVAEEELYYSLGRSRADIYAQLQVGFARVETWCKFRKPARHGDLMEVAIWIGKRTRRSLLFQFEMRRDGDPELSAEASYTVVCVNRQFQAVHLPPEVIELLREYLPPLTHGAADESGGARSEPRP